MARVYSQRLFLVTDLVTGTTDLGGPDTGTLWVVRHMSATCLDGSTEPLSGFAINITTLGPVWTLGGMNIARGHAYHWSGRHVVNGGEAMEFISNLSVSPGWTVLASGYVLVLP